MDALGWTCLLLVTVATVIGVAVFARGMVRLTGNIRMGRPADAGRRRPVARRVGLVVREMLGHGRFQHKPVVRVGTR